MPSVAELTKWVALDRVDDGIEVTFRPSRVPAAIRPVSPDSFGESKVTDIVTMRYHPQVTFNTRLTFTDTRRGITRRLFVKGIQNVDERDTWLVLNCEEVFTP
jgi:head-tail adaptor